MRVVEKATGEVGDAFQMVGSVVVLDHYLAPGAWIVSLPTGRQFVPQREFERRFTPPVLIAADAGPTVQGVA